MVGVLVQAHGKAWHEGVTGMDGRYRFLIQHEDDYRIWAKQRDRPNAGNHRVLAVAGETVEAPDIRVQEAKKPVEKAGENGDGAEEQGNSISQVAAGKNTEKQASADIRGKEKVPGNDDSPMYYPRHLYRNGQPLSFVVRAVSLDKDVSARQRERDVPRVRVGKGLFPIFHSTITTEMTFHVDEMHKDKQVVRLS